VAAEYFYQVDGVEFGPLTPLQLRQHASAGRLTARDLVRKEGTAEWLPARKYANLFPPAATMGPATPSAPPVPPPLPKLLEIPEVPPPVGRTIDTSSGSFAQLVTVVLRRSWREACTAALAAVEQTQRLAAYGYRAWCNRELAKQAAVSQEALGKKMYSLGLGDAGLRSQLVQLDEREKSVVAAKGQGRLIIAERCGLFQRLAEPVVNLATPPYQLADEHEHATIDRNALHAMRTEQSQRRSELFPSDASRRWYVVLGYCGAMLLILAPVWLFSGSSPRSMVHYRSPHPVVKRRTTTDPVVQKQSFGSNVPEPSPVVVPAHQGIKSFAKEFEKFRTLVQQEDWEGCINVLNQILERDPKNVLALGHRGDVWRRKKNWTAALHDLDNAITLEPKNSVLWNDRALVFIDQKDWKKALADIDESLRLDNTSSTTYSNRGMILKELKQYDQSLADLTKAIELDPNSLKAHINRALTYMATRQFESVISDFERAFELGCDDPDYINDYGLAFARLGRHQQAIAALNIAVEKNPKEAAFHYNRGLSYQHLQMFDEALAGFDQALKLNPNYKEAYVMRGCALTDLERAQDALRDFAEAERLNPEDATIYINRANAYAKLAQDAKGIADCTQAIQLAQNDPSLLELAYNNRGCAYERMGDLANARADFARRDAIRAGR